MTTINKTVAAISTPPGKGGVAVIRISGDDALKVAGKVFLPASKKDVSSLPSRMAVYGEIICGGRVIDDGILTLFRAPASYTGEDTAEICCHGGVLVSSKVLEACLSSGAVMAEAGDFTRRAYINGKITLSEAEAVGNLLEAKTGAQLALARSGTQGRLSQRVCAIYDKMCALAASVYALVDYPEEDLAELGEDEMKERLSDIISDIKSLCKTYEGAKVINEGIPTVICGAPNTGKSSLYNALVGEELAIVTDIAGTTRDALHTEAPLGDVLLSLYDTAGIHESDDTVEKIGIERSRSAIDAASLVLFTIDSSRPLCSDEDELIKLLSGMEGKCVIALFNKCDLDCRCDIEYVKARFAHTLKISAKKGTGMDELESLVSGLFLSDKIDFSNDAVIANARQSACARSALSAAEDALAALLAGMPADMAACDIERAMQALCEIDGQSVGEDITNEIFSKFCVGK